MGAIQSTINPYGSIWVVYDCFTNMNEIAVSLGTPYDPVIASYGTGSGCQSIVGDGDHISVIRTKYDWGGLNIKNNHYYQCIRIWTKPSHRHKKLGQDQRQGEACRFSSCYVLFSTYRGSFGSKTNQVSH